MGANDALRVRRPGKERMWGSARSWCCCWAPAINFVQRQLNAEDALYANGFGLGSYPGSSTPWGQRLSA